MFRLFRAFFSFFSGWFGAKADALNENPHVMAATYDAAIKNDADRYQRTKAAVANMIGNLERKRQNLITVTKDAEHLDKVKTGAAAKAKSVADQMKAQGKTLEEIKANPDYIKCLSAFNDASSTLKAKEERIAELDKDIAADEKALATYKAELQSMQRNQQKLQDEKSEAIADVQIANQREEVADMLAGISNSSSNKDLEAARNARRNAKARATISSELAGNDARASEAEFLEFAKTSEASSEFDALIGLEDNKVGETVLDPAKLAE